MIFCDSVRRLLCVFFCLAVSVPIGMQAQQKSLVNLSGYITDAQTGESLIGATVYHEVSKQGTISNNAGYYSLGLPSGNQRIRFSYVGYATVDTLLQLGTSTQVDIRLFPQQELQEVVVTGDKRSEFSSLETGRTRLSVKELQRMPTFLGEPDLIKYAQLQPGIARGYEGFSGLVVRGGNVDENLYLVDGNPLYNVNHLLGLFSTFNPDAVKTANIYKGSFPARFGGRLSSVLDVRTKDGNMKEHHGGISIGLISSRLSMEGPLYKDRTSYSVSLRRTYLDLLLVPWMKYEQMRKAQRKREQDGQESASAEGGYYFYDANIKLNHKFNDKHRVYLTLYGGDDVFYADVKSPMYKRGPSETSLLVGESKFYSHLKWGNKLASLGWNWVVTPHLFAHTTASYSSYLSDISVRLKTSAIEDGKTYTERGIDYRLDSGIKDYSLSTDLEFLRWNSHYIRFGGSFRQHFFRPNVESMNTKGVEWGHSKKGFLGLTRGKEVGAREYAFYAEDEMTLSPGLSVNIGGRLSLLDVEDKIYHSIEPRASLRQELTPNWSIKASYAEMSQYVHLLQGNILTLPTDLWVPSTKRIPPMRSRQGSLGLYWQRGKYEASLEGYYKQMTNLLAYRDGESVILSQSDWQDRVALGEGRAYGAELLLRKNEGRLSGWISYTLSWADRIYPNGEVNLGNRYPDRFDNRHRFNVALIYQLSPNVDFSAVWCYSTGNKITIPMQEYVDAEGRVKEYLYERNNYSMPDYHRLDLSLNLYRPKRNGHMIIWNFSVYNAYFHHNSFMIGSVDRNGPNGNLTVRSISPFLFIPSASFTYKF